MEQPIALFRPQYGPEEGEEVARVLESGWTGLGPTVERFEREFAAYLGVRHAVMTNSCTAALHLALALRGVGPGHRVAVPTMTFCSTAHAAKAVGAEPVLCDVDERTLLADWTGYEKVDAFVPVLYAGQPMGQAWMDQTKQPVVYDCAHAVGSTFDASGRLCCWSFHAVKNLACGEGGMLTTDEDELASRARRLRWMGIDRDTWDRSKHSQATGAYRWEYDVTEFGFKSHGNGLAAAVGLAQLRKLPAMQARREALWRRYREELGTVDWLPGHSCLLAVLRHGNRDGLIEHLRREGIGAGVHYRPLHLMSCYYGQRDQCPVASRVWRELVTLPLHPGMSDGDQDRVIRAVKGFR